MKQSRLSLTLAALLAAALAAAANPVGTWTGRVAMSKPPTLPPNATPEMRARMQQAMSMASKIRLVLTLKADKTFSFSMAGSPTGQNQPPHVGKWTQKGNVITVTSPEMGPQPRSLTLSPDGKTLTLAAPSGQGKVVFTR